VFSSQVGLPSPVCVSASASSLSHFVFARSPETNTTSTAEYAAVAAKMASWLALVDTLGPRAKIKMKQITRISRAFGLVTKYSTIIGQVSKNEAIPMLKDVTSLNKRRSFKCLNLSHSFCGKGCGPSARLQVMRRDGLPLLGMASGHAKLGIASLDRDGGRRATRSDS
jgi:hypothetical protein